ncbi:flagellar hook protein FlgE [Vibrio barjaei]|uniref:flagellar hook protein FlgE n=1 Tax=Vibrio barjaei TaxID=1676683 RepID=UPI0022851731|nr:flagellar hook protein FlgE [Vibrio barjaei]MCY9872317.1 flagellar hook protein FlgE [Vibrio barjaei]
MSFNIALSGLNATSEELGVVSNNIANSGTTGFKGSRTEFGSVYNGGQAGGVQVSAISQNFDKNGSLTGTGRALDLGLSGAGFFVVKDSKGAESYTRNGMFTLDSNGFVTTNTGSRLQGYVTDSNNNIQTGNVGDISVSTAPIAAKASTNVEFISNLDSREPVVDGVVNPFDPTNPDSYTHSFSTPVYDSQGNKHTVTQYFVKTGSNTWDVHAVSNGSTVGTDSITFNTDGTISSGGNYNVTFTPPGASAVNVAMDLSGVTQYASDFAVSTNSADGYTSGQFSNLRIESDGSVFATYTNGQSLLQGQVVLANFSSPQNLLNVSNTEWQQTFGSGSPVYGTAGKGVFGEISSGALEGSNVDLTGELVGLMSAQRNYQANTKSIQAFDQVTQSLFQVI